MNKKIEDIKKVLFDEKFLSEKDHPLHSYNNFRLTLLDEITDYLEYKKLIDFTLRYDTNGVYIWHNIYLSRDIGVDEEGDVIRKKILWEREVEELFEKTTDEFIEFLVKEQEKINKIMFFKELK